MDRFIAGENRPQMASEILSGSALGIVCTLSGQNCISLSGKTALVTGASRGIGSATALGLAHAGAQVLVHYGSGEKEAAAVVAGIQSTGGRARKITADLRAADGPHILAERVRAPYFLVRQLLPVMCEGSSGILVSSLAAHAAVGNLSAYSATKGAIDTLVRHVAAALGERGIRVNATASFSESTVRRGAMTVMTNPDFQIVTSDLITYITR